MLVSTLSVGVVVAGSFVLGGAASLIAPAHGGWMLRSGALLLAFAVVHGIVDWWMQRRPLAGGRVMSLHPLLHGRSEHAACDSPCLDELMSLATSPADVPLSAPGQAAVAAREALSSAPSAAIIGGTLAVGAGPPEPEPNEARRQAVAARSVERLETALYGARLQTERDIASGDGRPGGRPKPHRGRRSGVSRPPRAEALRPRRRRAT